jgi:hypothetical protein
MRGCDRRQRRCWPGRYAQNSAAVFEAQVALPERATNNRQLQAAGITSMAEWAPVGCVQGFLSSTSQKLFIHVSRRVAALNDGFGAKAPKMGA